MKMQTLFSSTKTQSTIRAEAVSPEETVLEVYGTIGESMFDAGITAQAVSDAIKAAGKSVTVRINSPGGSAFEGIAIYNILRSSGKVVRCIVDGLAASAASLIAMAGDVIEMGTGTMMMIHPAQMIAYGSASDMQAAAEILDKATYSMADIYVARTKMDHKKVHELMDAETWMTPEEALRMGFATAKTERKGEMDAVAAVYDLAAVYTNTPDALKVYQPEAQLEPVPQGTPMADAAKRKLQLY